MLRRSIDRLPQESFKLRGAGNGSFLRHGLERVIQSPPSNAGFFSFGSTGDYIYEPSEHFSGQDSFSYRADDGFELAAPAAVTFNVTPVADAPLLTVQNAGRDRSLENRTHEEGAARAVPNIEPLIRPRG